MKKIKVIAGIAIAVVLLGLAGIWLFLDVNKFRPQIQARLEQQFRRQVTLGEMSLGLIPFRITVNDLEISEDPQFTSAFPFTKAKQLDVRVRLLPLIAGNVEVDSIDFVEPSVELIRNREGVWNFSTLGASATPDGTTPTPQPNTASAPVSSDNTAPAPNAEEGSSAAKSFSLRRLAIRDGSIAITDGLKNQPRAVYSPIDISLTDYAPGKPFSFDVAAHIPGDGSQTIEISGTGGPMPDAGPATMPLNATVSLKEIDIAGLRQFLDSEYVSNATGRLSGETKIESQSGKLSGKGALTLNQAQVGGLEIGYPIDLSYDLSSDVAEGLIDISSATLKLGMTPFSLSGTINTNPVPMEVNLHLQSGEASIEEVARLASAFGIAFSPDTTVAGRFSGDVRARGPIDNLALNGNVSGKELQISGKNLPQAVQVRELNLALSPTEIRSNEFQATSGKSTVTGRVALRQYTSKTPTIDVSLRAPSATLPEIQTIAKAYGVTGLDQLDGAGALSFDLRAAGPLDSVASENVMRALNGNMDLGFETIKIQGIDASRELARIGGFLKSNDGGNGFTNVLKLTGHVAVKNGVAETSDLLASLEEGTLAVTGKSDLAEESLNLKATAILSKGFSNKVGGTEVGGYLKTALSNDQGELVIPVLISGTFKEPKFSPDTQALLQMQKNRLLPGLNNPKSALGNVLNSLTGGGQKEGEAPTEGQTPSEGESKPANNLKGVLQGILGGKK